jgi:hypothetical protein
MLHKKATLRREICERCEPPWTQGFTRRLPGLETAEDAKGRRGNASAESARRTRRRNGHWRRRQSLSALGLSYRKAMRRNNWGEVVCLVTYAPDPFSFPPRDVLYRAGLSWGLILIPRNSKWMIVPSSYSSGFGRILLSSSTRLRIRKVVRNT